MSEFVGQQNAVAAPTDVDVCDQMQKLVAEAAERATFHRGELERWMRVGRAAAAAVSQLQAAEPFAQTAVDDFYAAAAPTKAYAPQPG